MHIAIVTAGGAGMFCGSCMHDNTWARALQARGAEVTLVPTYTPIRVDEEDHSTREVFFGGINIYLEHRLRFWRKLPPPFIHWLDAPWILRLASKVGVSNDAHKLGELTLAMLDGESGPHDREVDELVRFLATQLHPDVICFSNTMLSGAVRRLKEQTSAPVFCLLQGDDVFLDDLREPHRSQAIDRIKQRAAQFDGFLVHSRYYRDYMAEYFNLPLEKFHQMPLGIDVHGHDGQPKTETHNPFTIGYFARICPEKGLKELVAAFRIVHEKHPHTRLVAGGYLGKRDAAYFREIRRETRNLGTSFEYIGSPQTHTEKVAFYKSLDVLSVPTPYREPKGLYVLEALANGVPVIQPNHGAFPELIESTGGGLLVEPNNPRELAAALERLLGDSPSRLDLATTGRSNVHARYNSETMADETIKLFEGVLQTSP